MSALTATARRATTAAAYEELKDYIVENFITDRFSIPDGTSARLLDYEVVSLGNGRGRELIVKYMGSDGNRNTTHFSEEKVMKIIADPRTNKFDRMTLSAGLGYMRITVDYGLNKY